VTPLGRTGIRTRQIVRKLAPTGRGVEFVSAPGPATPELRGRHGRARKCRRFIGRSIEFHWVAISILLIRHIKMDLMSTSV
jgi:hypothetical protein